jgi:hypothetical protein
MAVKRKKTIREGRVDTGTGIQANGQAKVSDSLNTDLHYYERAVAVTDPEFYYDKVLADDATTMRVYNSADNKLILTGVYKDDFFIGIQNQWQSGNSSILKTAVDTVASYLTGSDAKFASAAVSWIGDTVINNADQQRYKDIGQGIKNFGERMEQVSNSHIFSSDDYFKAFKGTSVTFPTNMSVTLLTDSYFGVPGHRDKDIYDILRNVLSISIGEMKDVGAMTGIEAFSGFVGIQAPPNLYKADFSNIGIEDMEGTIHVVFGDPSKGGFTVKNLVVSSVQFNISKTMVQVSPMPPKLIEENPFGMVKDKNGWAAQFNAKKQKVIVRPLFIDINLSFEPAKMMTLNDITKILPA